MPHLAHSLAGGWRAALGAVALAATAWTGDPLLDDMAAEIGIHQTAPGTGDRVA